jgi:diguanylate cyclase (GGDEF)-like protein
MGMSAMRKELKAQRREQAQRSGGAAKLERENSLLRDEVARLRIALTAQRQEMEALQAHAVQDALLPVLNRRGFVAEVMKALSFCARYRMPATLIYCDLDDFKQINDNYGHETGDRVLLHAVTILQDSIRRSDIIGRLGGDEFGILLWNACFEGTEPKIEMLQTTLADQPCETLAGPLPISMSIGIAEVQLEDTPEALIARADAAMYAQKRARHKRLDEADA